MSDKNLSPAAEAYIHRLEAHFLCDDLAMIVHRLRELISDSESHSRIVFLSSANDVICDLLETVDRGWTAIEEIAEDLKR